MSETTADWCATKAMLLLYAFRTACPRVGKRIAILDHARSKKDSKEAMRFKIVEGGHMEHVVNTAGNLINYMFVSLLDKKDPQGAHATPSPCKTESCSGASTHGDRRDSFHDLMDVVIEEDDHGYPMPPSLESQT